LHILVFELSFIPFERNIKQFFWFVLVIQLSFIFPFWKCEKEDTSILWTLKYCKNKKGQKESIEVLQKQERTTVEIH